MTARTRLKKWLLVLLSVAMVAFATKEAYALMWGSEGNTPIPDPGWPEGAAVIFNHPSRIAHWSGDGRPDHAECRGNAKVLSAILADFAKLNVKNKSILLHDGIGYSYWMAKSKEPALLAKAQMDWDFTVWQSGNGRVRVLGKPLGKQPDAESPAQIDVYTGGNIKWADVIVPKGLKVVDNRLESHGFTLADGIVLEGKVTDLATKKPLSGKVKLELIEPQPKGGYGYSVVTEAKVDAEGHWVLKKVPPGWQRVLVEVEGFVPRVVGHIQADAQPKWQAFDGALSRPASITGRVADDAGQPLAEVEVRLDAIVTNPGGRYDSPLDNPIKTDAEGRFRAEKVAIGTTTIWVNKPGYTRPGLGLPITTPKDDIALVMIKAARAIITVDFTGKVRPNAYIVSIEPEGGNVIGSWGGSGHIDNNNKITFENAPPGVYVIRGQPNPGAENQKTTPISIELKGGKTGEFTLNAK